MGFRVEGLVVQGSRFYLRDSATTAAKHSAFESISTIAGVTWGLRCRVQGSGFRVHGSGCRVRGAGCRVQGAGCRVQARGRVTSQQSGFSTSNFIV